MLGPDVAAKLTTYMIQLYEVNYTLLLLQSQEIYTSAVYEYIGIMEA